MWPRYCDSYLIVANGKDGSDRGAGKSRDRRRRASSRLAKRDRPLLGQSQRLDPVARRQHAVTLAFEELASKSRNTIFCVRHILGENLSVLDTYKVIFFLCWKQLPDESGVFHGCNST